MSEPAGSPYLNMPTRRASDKALQLAVTELLSTRARFVSEGQFGHAMLIDQALRDIEALIPGATTGEGR